MARKSIVSKAAGAISSLAKDAAAALLTTRSAGKPSLSDLGVPVPASRNAKKGSKMAKKRKQSSRGRKQDRARVAGGQDYEVRYEAKKTGKSKKAVKRVGNTRKKVERALKGKR
jgi:Protein of unknown function (DUF3606)